jgi:hypothetical protein
MSTTLAKQAARPGRGVAARGVLVAIAAIAFSVLAGCGNTSQPASLGASGNAGSSGGAAGSSGSANPASSSGSGNISAGNRGSGQGNEGTGTFTVAFARCMRAHGVANFPDPTGQSGQLGPNSGIDPTSPAFQAAVNGPCLTLAPAGWVSSGKVTR